MPDPEITSPPNLLFEKSGFTAATVVRQINPQTIQIEYIPNQVPLIGFIFSGLLTAAFAWMGVSFAILSGALGIYFLLKMLGCRSIRCEMDKQSGSILYFRSFLEENEQKTLRIDGIYQLEMQRHVNRGGDTYHVNLCMKGADPVSITENDLSFSECQRLTSVVRDFIDKELPISAAD